MAFLFAPLRRLRAPRARTLGAVALLSFATGCGDVARMIAPGSRDAQGPARVSLQTSIAAQVGQAGETVALGVNASYVRAGGARVAMGTQRLALSAAQVQAVPIPIDVAACMADATRDAVPGGGCPVVLRLALTVNDVVVDEQVIGPLALAPGATTTVSDPVTLFEIATVAVSRRDGGAVDRPVPVTVGATLDLRALVRDSRAQTVSDRAISWTSATPTVATVDANGTVRGVAPGTARITAAVGTITGSVDVQVLRPPVEVTLALAGSGQGSVRSTPAGIDCQWRGGTSSGSCRALFASDSAVTLTTTTETGTRFDGWGEACVSAAGATSCVLRPSQAARVSARLVAQRRVRVSATGDGSGFVTSEPAGIDCGISGGVASGRCDLVIDEGAALTLRAVGATGTPGSVFGGWSGGCTGMENCALSAATDLAVTANFQAPRTLSVTLGGTGTGRVTGGEIDCTGAAGRCRSTVPHGSTVTLVATPSADARFEGWNDCPQADAARCTVTVGRNQTVHASFAKRLVALTVTLTGPGAGTLAVDGRTVCTLAEGQPSATCVVEAAVGARLAITATAAAGARVGAVSGACTTLAGCTITLSSPQALQLRFDRDRVPLTIRIQGGGFGSVQLPGAPACTRLTPGQPVVECTTLVNADATVSLLAVPDDGSVLTSFSAPCGTALTCTVLADQPRTITATFDPQLITVAFGPSLGATGRGRVRSTIGPTVDCNYGVGGLPVGASCGFTAPVGTLMVLRAEPDLVAGIVFAGWTGVCAGSTSTTCTFVVRPNTPETIAARFMAPTP